METSHSDFDLLWPSLHKNDVVFIFLQNDAVHFSLDWKLPCAVVFTRRDINGRHETASK